MAKPIFRLCSSSFVMPWLDHGMHADPAPNGHATLEADLTAWIAVTGPLPFG
jgi:hypothetical protein